MRLKGTSEGSDYNVYIMGLEQRKTGRRKAVEDTTSRTSNTKLWHPEIVDLCDCRVIGRVSRAWRSWGITCELRPR